LCATAMVCILPSALIGQTFNAQSYLDRALAVRSEHPDSARFYTDAIFEAYRSTAPDSTALRTILDSANMRRRMSDFSKTREILAWVKEHAEKPGNEKHLAFFYQTLGITDSQQGRYQTASENLLRGLQLYDKVDDLLNKAIVMKELGIVYERLKMYEQALRYGKDGLNVIRSVGDSSMVAGYLADVGTMHQNIGKLDEALPYQLESLRIHLMIGEEIAIPYNYHNIGDVFLQLGMLDSSETYTRKAYDGFVNFKLDFPSLYSLMNLGVLNMERGNYVDAEQYLLKSYNTAKEFDGLYEQAMVLEKLSTLYERMGRVNSALKYLKDSYSVRDSLTSADRERAILDMAESYKNDQVLQEIEQLREREALSNQLIGTQRAFLAVVSIGLIVIVIALMRMTKANKLSQGLNRELVEANTRLTSISDEKNNLIHVMAHDLRTPLAQISGLSMLLRGTDGVNDEQAEFIVLIDEASSNGLAIISQMMESNSNMSAPSTSSVAEDVDLHRIIDSSLSLYAAQARSKDISIVFDDTANNPVIKNDPLAIRRVVDNLVSNAIKYTYPGTEIRVSLITEDDKVKFLIRDAGPGFSADDKLLLFRKFTTLSARPTGGEPSTGLGLAIVYDLVGEVGGLVYLVDDGQPGACFCVELPM
jgi:signal transduction histidine kinase